MPIQIDVTNGVITCAPGDGYVRTVHSTQIAWTSTGEEFTLTFQLLGGDGSPVWPFVEPQPAWPVRAFQGTLTALNGDPPPNQRPAYKYTVVVGANRLDPIIIVDKN
jgi:hypothetical protein